MTGGSIVRSTLVTFPAGYDILPGGRLARCPCTGQAVIRHTVFARGSDLMSMDPTKTDAWQALTAHADTISGAHLRDLFADDTERGGRLTATGRRPLRRLLEEPGDRRDAGAAHRARRPGRSDRADRRHVRRRAHQHQRGPRRPAHRAAATSQRDAGRGRPGRRGRRARGAGQDGRLRGARTLGELARVHRRADRDRGQHRHRRLRPRPGDGVRGTEGVRGRTRPAGSSPTSTRPTSTTRPTTSIRRPRCSSSCPRRSPRWRR